MANCHDVDLDQEKGGSGNAAAAAAAKDIVDNSDRIHKAHNVHDDSILETELMSTAS